MTISSWQIEFARPLWFALLAALPLLLIFWRRSLVQFSPAGRSCRLCCEVCCCCSWPPAWRDRSATGPGKTAAPRRQVAGKQPSSALARVSNSSRRTRSAPASRFRSRCSCDQATAQGHPGIVPRRQPLLKVSPVLAGGESEVMFSDVVLKPSRVVYSIRVKDGARRLAGGKRKCLCGLRRSAAAGAAGRKPAGTGRTSQKGPGRRECRGRSPAGTARRTSLPITT